MVKSLADWATAFILEGGEEGVIHAIIMTASTHLRCSSKSADTCKNKIWT